ncbi:MAG: alpha/beta hydrolase [Deltaproteobacteria bacterium]|nr:alpha/beta hydrolase [Deltaproteobacteria bacterium]
MTSRLELALGVLNGAVGDYLARTRNGLATEMTLVHQGRPVPAAAAALARAYPQASRRAVLLVHGLMCTEDVWRLPDGSDYGSLLERDFGWTPLYLRFNSGLPIPDNGVALARLLEALPDVYPGPLEELVFVGFSLGGLVVRSACHEASLAGSPWLKRVRRAFYVGTPHRGAALERLGRAAAGLLRVIPDPYARLVAELGDLRSEGIKDLGDADLRHEDRARRRDGITLRDPQHPVPLLPGIAHHLVAGSVARDPRLSLLFGDAVVALSSATDGSLRAASPLPADRVHVIPEATHLQLAHDLRVYDRLRAWCAEGPDS